MEIKRKFIKFAELGVAATAVATLVLVGCGGGGGGVSSPSGLALSGNMVDGYVQGATVTLDVNDNGICESTEPTTTTGPNGNFTFTAAQNPGGGQHMTCASGGTDISTKLPFVGQLLAPPGATQITPLTNVIMQQVLGSTPNATPAQITAAANTAAANFATTLGITLPADQTLLTADPVAATNPTSTLLQVTVAPWT